jgi:HAD domain in Swiss Army Knife RNA repair proteins
MKIIFLDIDGVLNCKSTPNPRKFPYVVDPKLIVQLKSLIEKTDARVVLSSTWRLDPVGLLAARYWDITIFDVCPDMPGSARCKEILAWLSSHSDVTRFIVVDDEDDQLDDLPLFQPSSRTGITEEIVTIAADYLNGKSDSIFRRSVLRRRFQNVRSLFNRDKS